MNNGKTIHNLMTVLSIITVILAIITFALQVTAFNALRHVILCSCILLLITVELVFDEILKDSKGITMDIIGLIAWLPNLILNLPNI